MGNNLPKGWGEVPLKDVADARMGETILAKELTKSGVPVYSAGQDNSPWGFLEEPKKINCKGTIVVSARGSIGFPKIPVNDSFASTQTTIALKLKDKKLTSFCCLWLRTVNWKELTKGGAIPMLTVGDINKLVMPLPPDREREKILSKLELLLPKVKDAQSRLDKIPTILGRFRQSVLAAAFSGELTKAWRKKNKCLKIDNLLKRNEYKLSDDIELPDLPESWMWCALGNYADCSRGRFSIRPRNDPRYYGGKYPFIQIGDLPREGGYINKHSQTLNDLGLGISKMFPKGTVAIAIVGATIANTGILGYDMCFPDSMVGIETGDEIRNRYCELFLRYKKYDIRQEAYSSGGQPNIKLQTLNPLPIAIAPAKEQIEVVKRVEYQLHIIDEFLGKYQHVKGYTDKLEQSILAKAFRGELVS